jgi:hypothetical protein
MFKYNETRIETVLEEEEEAGHPRTVETIKGCTCTTHM